MSTRIDRRSFLWGGTAGLLLSQGLLPRTILAADISAAEMKPWEKGFLDIHHISTGRGNSVLAICPDGTSIMIDAGSVRGPLEPMGPARPNDSRRPGEWIGRYALHHLRTAPRQELDYFVLTHFHGDHMGDIFPESPRSKQGDYRLTGVTDVAEILPIRRLIDRGFPNYSYPEPATYDAALNYINFARFASRHGTKVEQLQVGSSTQIALQHDASILPPVTIQNLAANGDIWTGHGTDTVSLFPKPEALKHQELPTENACSIALRLSFGAFRYYIGGDLTCDTRFGTAPWMDVESPVSRVAGPTTVSALDHHGYYDGTGTQFVKNMRSRIYVLQSWHASHPALSVLDELYSPILSAGQHDVLSTGLVEAASLADARLSTKMLSQHGHVVIRAYADRETFEVFVLDDSREQGSVTGSWGPFPSAPIGP